MNGNWLIDHGVFPFRPCPVGSLSLIIGHLLSDIKCTILLLICEHILNRLKPPSYLGNIIYHGRERFIVGDPPHSVLRVNVPEATVSWSFLPLSTLVLLFKLRDHIVAEGDFEGMLFLLKDLRNDPLRHNA